MKGIILAGGQGTRLKPLTDITNKHLLPIYNKQLIFYPLNTLINSGVDDILITSHREYIGDFSKLLGSGEEYGVNITYKVQEKAGGIAEALGLAKGFIGESNKPFLLILGDNIFQDALDIRLGHLEKAKVFIKATNDHKSLGIAEFDEYNVIKKIHEKPDIPYSGMAVLGAYIYYPDVFDIVKTLKPSARGELEISDLNNYYVERKQMGYSIVKGFWKDAGKFDNILDSAIWVRNKKPLEENL